MEFNENLTNEGAGETTIAPIQSSQPLPLSPLRKLLIIEYALIIALCLLNIYLYRFLIINQLKEWKIWKLPETLTELYFTEHLSLPSTFDELGVDQKVRFKFTVHNLEYKVMEYKYEVWAYTVDENTIKEITESSGQNNENNNTIPEAIDKETLLEQGQVQLIHGGYKTIQIAASLPNQQKRTRIAIRLKDQNQEIHFWIDKSN